MPLPSTAGPYEALINLSAVGTGSAALAYTCPDKRKLTDIYLVNRTAGNLTITAYIVAPGDTAGNNNIFLPTFTILANDVRMVTGLQYALEKGYALWVVASGAGINWAVMGTLNR